jgi:hypothetical protein
MLDLDKLEAALREQLAKETTESVEAWFAEYERNNQTIEIEDMTHTNNNREFWLQVVPDDASDFMIRMGYLDHITQGGSDYISLPSGTWAIHSDSATITESQAAELVEKVHIRTHEEWAYRNYTEGFKLNEIGVTIGYSFAIDSFESLLRSLNINNRVIILEKLC